MMKSAHEATFFRDFNTDLERLSLLYARVNRNQRKYYRVEAKKNLREFLEDGIRKKHLSKDDNPDNSDDDEALSPAQKRWRQYENSMEQRYEKRMLERQMVADPEKKISELLDKFNNITEETKQLIEVKDIIDELKMIYEIQGEQNTVVRQFADFINGGMDETRLWRFVASGEYQRSEIMTLSEKAKETLKAVRHIYVCFWKTILTFRQIEQLLELKQKQANASEARTTRMQAEQSDKQGKVRPDKSKVCSC